MTTLTFYGIRELTPGPRWRQLFDATWAGYRRWYLSEGESTRPSVDLAHRMLERYMPELTGTWERLVELSGGDDTAARMLTLYDPPRFLPGCSQLALTGETPMLIRNYDYRPDLCERVVLSSAFTGRRVIGSSDCLWGLLDGMNDAGLAISLAFGGRRGVASGFGIPLIIRYVLEVAESLVDAVGVLARVPVNMAYNLTILDRNGETASVFVAPGVEPEVFARCPATNHRGTVPDDPEHARRFRSVERQRALLALLARQPDPNSAVSAFLQPPLYNTGYAAGFGTMYTAAYRPNDGVVDYVWPGSSWRRGFDSPNATHAATYRPESAPVLPT
jgi:predicted choloylglycine hydrolase